MARHEEHSAALGNESFLDVVTNMVGILIILVMVMGMKIKNTPVTLAPSQEMVAAATDLEKVQGDERVAVQDVARLSDQIEQVQAQAAVRGQERDVLATLVSAAEHKIAEERGHLDAGSQADFDLRRQAAETQAELDRLQQQRTAAENAQAAPEVVESYPTPISKTVDGDEAHFHLRGGSIALVPVERLVSLARDQIRARLEDLVRHDELPESSDTVGPVEGFRLRYTVERFEETARSGQGLMRRAGVRMKRWSVIPVSSRVGEPVNAALAEGSKLRQALARMQPGKTTITVWVYEDSFASFRKFRKTLHGLGFAIAARPLPTGMMIAGSPEGSKSSAE